MVAFSMSVAEENGTCRVRLCGDLNLSSSQKLRASLDHIRGPIVFDCADLSFIDVGGIAVFAELNENGGVVLLRHVSAELWRLLHVSGLSFLIDPLEYWATPHRP